MNLIQLAELGVLPDSFVRAGIRRLIDERRRQISGPDHTDLDDFVAELKKSPLAVETDAANTQHYEVPPAFFINVLGPRLKYSSGYFASPDSTLAEAEDEMLRLSCQRAEIEDGMRILDLGCGWGSLSLWVAERFPNCRITAVSNSTSQRTFIETSAAARGLSNVRVVTADMGCFNTEEQFDRIVSVEMFEHMRNYELLFRRIANWLAPDGKAFVHVFCHRSAPYAFETEGARNWMGRHFFTGGTMPSFDLFGHFAEDLAIDQQWQVNGKHYWRTCEAWLENLDRNRKRVLACFQRDLSPWQARVALQRWRMFLMSCSELFRYRQGSEWFVGQYLFSPASVKQRMDERLALPQSG